MCNASALYVRAREKNFVTKIVSEFCQPLEGWGIGHDFRIWTWISSIWLWFGLNSFLLNFRSIWLFCQDCWAIGHEIGFKLNLVRIWWLMAVQQLFESRAECSCRKYLSQYLVRNWCLSKYLVKLLASEGYSSWNIVSIRFDFNLMKKWVYKWLNIGVQALSMNSRLIKQYVLRIRGLSDLEQFRGNWV